MEHWMLETMNSFGYLGIFLLILAENIFPPIPSEVILTFSGFMTTYTKMHVDRKSTRLNSSHSDRSRMPSSA